MTITRSRAALGGAVFAVALLTAGCWRAAPIDGPGATPGIGTTTHAVNNDKAAAWVFDRPTNRMVLLTTDTTTNSMRFGEYAADHTWHWSLLDGPGTIGPGATTHALGGGAELLETDILGATPAFDAFYFDNTSGSLRNAHINGASITRTVIDGADATTPGHTSQSTGQSANPAIFHNAQLSVFYTAVSQTEFGPETYLRHAEQTPQGWVLESVDGAGAPGGGGRTGHNAGDGASVAIFFPSLDIHAFYDDTTSGRIRHAVWNGSTWSFQDLDGPGVPGGAGRTGHHVGGATAALMGPDSLLHVFYADLDSGRIRDGKFDGSTWSFTDLDGPGVPGGAGRTGDTLGGSLTMSRQGGSLMNLVYSDLTKGSVRHAELTGSGWRFETVDGPGALTVGGATHPLSQPTVTGPAGLGANAAVVAGDPFHPEVFVFSGDPSTGDLREACSLGAGMFAPPTCDF